MNNIVLFLRSMGEHGMAEEVEAEHNRLEAFASGLDKDCLVAQFKAGAASRDAEVAELCKQVTLLRGYLMDIRQKASKRDAFWVCSKADEALAATADLDGLILCHAEPCRDDGRCQYAIDHGAEGLGHCPEGKCCMPLYRAWEPKP